MKLGDKSMDIFQLCQRLHSSNTFSKLVLKLNNSLEVVAFEMDTSVGWVPLLV